MPQALIPESRGSSMRRYSRVLALLFMSMQCAPAAATPPDDLQASLTKMISRLEAEMANAEQQDKPAFAATIDNLIRLRDRNSWPVVNSPIAITTLQNTKWEALPDANGFRQTIWFGGSGQGGLWHTHPRAKPFDLCWAVESDRIRLSHLDCFRGPHNYQIVDRTFTYQINEATLIMKRGEDVLKWQRVSPDASDK